MNEYVIAEYIRLSQDDAVSDSLSIPNQHLLLGRHIDELDIPGATVLEFVDNGHTGTNLDRPAVQEMLEMVRCGKIHCIIVKDFSRFSRNAMESGYYIEQVFPLYRVRFIAIGENFDSNDYKDGTGGIDVAFRFLMHEHYSKDLSKKIKSAKRVLMRNGEYIVAGAIYGYRKNDSGRWEPDPGPAGVVRQIFDLALDGLSTAQIRDKMFEARVLTPREYTKIQQKKEIVLAYLWSTRMIHRTLTNEQYTGSYVSGKHELKRIGSGARINNEKVDWIVIPDSHPDIVCNEEFARVQEILKAPKETAPGKPVPSGHSNASRPRIASGERVSSAVPYGYVKGDGGKWVVDETSAGVVRRIFEMTQQGLTVREICDRLQEAGHPTPSEYFKLARGHAIQPANIWPKLRIQEILKDEQYVGTYIAGKSFQDDDGKKYRLPKSEWIVIPDKHPPIISREVFDEVQEIRMKSRSHMHKRDYLLAGKTACGCCGFALVYNDSTVPSTYRCSHTHQNPDSECHKMKVSAVELEGAVLTIIRKQAEVVLASRDLSGMRKLNTGEKLIAECEKQIRECVERRQEYYERLIEGAIDRDAHTAFKADCAAQLDTLNNRLSALKQAERDKQTGKKMAALAKEALGETATPQDIVNALVEKVVVYPGNRIEIQWKVQNFVSELI
jgi:DNA invertase Pin-like site-specific DNA recombinase